MTIEQYVNSLIQIEREMMKLHAEKVELMQTYLDWIAQPKEDSDEVS